MKRSKIELYIEGRKADVGSDTAFPMTYTMEDLTNPTAVVNSYAVSVSLPGTPTNDAIFGHFERDDRRVVGGLTNVGVDFAPQRRMSFVLYNELSEVIERGYLKLEKVKRHGRNGSNPHEFEVSLYGGLGSVLYDLTYDGAGNRLTLADLEYFNEDDTTADLSHDLTIADGPAAGWKRLAGDTSQDKRWDVINYAPAYNGNPKTDRFDADKVLVDLNTVTHLGIPTSDGGTSAHNGFVLVKMDEASDEWEMRDVRSYLQRPVLRVEKIIEAIGVYSSDHGHPLTFTGDFFDPSNPYYFKTWMTLPTLQEQDVAGTETTVHITKSAAYTGTWGWVTPAILLSGIATGEEVDGTIPVDVLLEASTDVIQNLGFRAGKFAILVASYIIGGSEVGYSVAYVLCNSAADVNIADVETKLRATGIKTENITYTFIEGPITHIGSKKWKKTVNVAVSSNYANTITLNFYVDDQFRAGGSNKTINAAHANVDADVVKRSTPLRSGAHVTKSLLLGQTMSPADFLLSMVKTFGLVFVHDPKTGATRVMDRNAFFTAGNFSDISDRVAVDEAEVTPLLMSSRWYDFEDETAESAKASRYLADYGHTYGRKRYSTGYEFNDEAVNLAESSHFRGAVQVLGYSRKMCYPNASGTKRMSWQERSHEITYGVPGSSHAVAVQPFTAAAFSFYGPQPFKDADDRPEFRDADNNGIDGGAVLLFFDGMGHAVQCSDDTAEMVYQNSGNSCWLLSADPTIVESVPAPHFTRLLVNSSGAVSNSLDFGVPAEVYVEGLTAYSNTATIAGNQWDVYLSERFDADVRVLKVKVRLKGLHPEDPYIFAASFFFGGSEWHLNRCERDLSDPDALASCEFVRVIDHDNYMDQTY